MITMYQCMNDMDKLDKYGNISLVITLSDMNHISIHTLAMMKIGCELQDLIRDFISPMMYDVVLSLLLASICQDLLY